MFEIILHKLVNHEQFYVFPNKSQRNINFIEISGGKMEVKKKTIYENGQKRKYLRSPSMLQIHIQQL